MPPVMEAPVRDPESVEVPSTQDVAELHLLIGEMDDEITRYRRREAVWLSIVVHAVVFLLVIFAPKWWPKSATVIPLEPQLNNKDITFMMAPPDQQRVKRPNTDIASDKNRIAQSRTPVLNKDALRKILDASRPGPPAHQAPPPTPAQQAQQQAPQQPAQQQQQQQGTQNGLQAPPQPTQQAQLHTPAPGGNPFKTTAPGIQGALDSLSASHGKTRMTFGGDYGAHLHSNTDMRGELEITSDTMGVDFGPYLQRVLYAIKTHWYELIPEVARPPLMKNGSLIIGFAILKDGRVSGMQIDRPSGDISLDRAAFGGITNSNPFDRLPAEFPGEYLGLRIKFIYNPTAKELQ